MMSKLGAMFVLLLLFTLASSQEKGDVQAGKTQKSDFYRTLTRSARGCTMSCAFQNNICQGTCHCSGSTNCYCASGHHNTGCGCACTNRLIDSFSSLN
uniref:Conotoxin Superfamily S n=1 Tax=Conus episcopatus TaxID=88764 RepID=A0A0K2S6X9_CONEP|nr:Conotoxin Superfamily S [Conus episcopatus]